MKSSWLLAAPFALALASPAMAVGFCDDSSDGFSIGATVKVSAGFHIGEPYTEEEQGLLDQMQLRRDGRRRDPRRALERLPPRLGQRQPTAASSSSSSTPTATTAST